MGDLQSVTVKSNQLADLLGLRSQFVEALLMYLDNLANLLARNPLLSRFGRRLDEVRIPLRVVPFEPIRELEEIRLRERLREQATHADDEEEQTTSRRISAFRGTPFEPEDREHSAPQPLAELEPALEMAVLLGDPGSGKTEWLKFFARSVARASYVELHNVRAHPEDLALPVYARLPELAAALADDHLVAKLVEAGCLRSAGVLSHRECCAGAIVIRLLEDGMARRLAPWVFARLTRPRAQGGRPAVVCLDAWDEVRSNRARLAGCLRAFAAECYVRVFVTSRVLGYADAPLPVEKVTGTARPELQLCPFDWTETETFVTEFFASDAETGQNLIGELRQKVEVAGMAQNPLMATLLCLSFTRDLGDPLSLPARRVEVFDRVLNGLLGVWAAQRAGEPADAELITAKRKLLEAIAARFFPDEVIGGDALDEVLWHPESGFLTRLPGGHPLARSFSQSSTGIIQQLCEDGVLIPCGGPASVDYTFLHLTFQEYLTARFLAGRAKNGNWKKIERLVDKKCWLPEWEEVIVLLAGALDDPLPLLRLLSVPGKDDEFRHRLCLAARCLPELWPVIYQKTCGGLTKKVSVNGKTDLDLFAGRIAEDLLDLNWDYQPQDIGFPHLSRAFRAAAAGRPEVVLPGLVAYLRHEFPGARRKASEALGRLGPTAAAPEVVATLVERLGDAYPEVREGAAVALGRLGPTVATSQVVEVMMQLLSDADKGLRWRAAAALKRLGPMAMLQVLTAVSRRLDDADAEVRSRAEVALGELDPTAANGAAGAGGGTDAAAQRRRCRNSRARGSASSTVGRGGDAGSRRTAGRGT